MICEVWSLGTIPYEEAWALQRRLAQPDEPDRLLLLSHPHTYTLGTAADESNVLWGEAERERRGVSLYRVDRGGDVTYHGPGQLVGYPILHLLRPTPDQPVGTPCEPRSPMASVPHTNPAIVSPSPAVRERGSGGEGLSTVRGKGEPLRIGVVDYLRKLEQVIILTLSDYDVTAKIIPGLTGVWVDTPRGEEKIAAIGVKINVKAITQHGFAINLNTDLAYFGGIIPCGIVERGVTSLARLTGAPVDEAAFAERLIARFGEVFGFEMLALQPSIPASDS